jgi:signal transduction histidine kinase
MDDDRGARSETRPEGLDELLAGVSHDLKSPLSAIMMAAASLARINADERATPQIRRKADTIQRCAERMAKVLDDLYDVVRLQSGRFSIAPGAPGAAAEIVAEAVEKSRAAADERRIELRTSLALPLPELACDRGRIVQALACLLADAIRVTDTGGVVSAGASRAQESVVFFVEDAGPAIAPEELAHVFERGRHSPTAQRRGAPLGLLLARGIVAAHAGRIWAESDPSRGNRFSFAIPLATS